MPSPTVYPVGLEVTRAEKQSSQPRQLPSQSQAAVRFQERTTSLVSKLVKKRSVLGQFVNMQGHCVQKGFPRENLQRPLLSKSLLINALNAARNKGRQPALQGTGQNH